MWKFYRYFFIIPGLFLTKHAIVFMNIWQNTAPFFALNTRYLRTNLNKRSLITPNEGFFVYH